jgi:DinB superfamily
MDLSYPIGKFDWTQSITPEKRIQFIGDIAGAPAKFREASHGLDKAQLDTPYRPDGWTVREVVHHVADSHMNSYIRFRLALTEEQPSVKGYDEKEWAKLHDSTLPVTISLNLLEALHERWVNMLQSMTDADFTRTFHHSEKGQIRLDMNLALYSWHSRHHAAHITGLRKRMGWV